MTHRQRYVGAPTAYKFCLLQDRLSSTSAAPAKGRCLPMQETVLPVCAEFHVYWLSSAEFILGWHAWLDLKAPFACDTTSRKRSNPLVLPAVTAVKDSACIVLPHRQSQHTSENGRVQGFLLPSIFLCAWQLVWGPVTPHRRLRPQHSCIHAAATVSFALLI